MANNRRNIRKRQFDASKSLKFFRNSNDLFNYLNGENQPLSERRSFEEVEKCENMEKIAAMFLKKKRNVPIPDITANLKENQCTTSDDTHKTNITKDLEKSKGPEAVNFYFKPRGLPSVNYVKYIPKMVSIKGNHDFK